MRHSVLALLLGVAMTGLPGISEVAVAASAGTDAQTRQRLDATIDQAIREQRVIGTVVVLMRDGKVVYERAAGHLDREAHSRMPKNAIFRLASSSKAITSAAAMKLVEDGRLHLDDPVTRWLPEFKPKSVDGSAPTITIWQLLTHTAGLDYPFWETPEGPYRRARVSSGLDQPGLEMDEELARITAAGLVNEPGTQWRYSLSIDVLGAVIAKVTGKRLPDAIRELITAPLGLADTGFHVADRHRLAVPYYNSTPRPGRMAAEQPVDFGDSTFLVFTPSRAFDASSFPSGGAGMLGTAQDFSRFLEAIRTGGGAILKGETVKAMLTNQTGSLLTLSGPGWGFGFGAGIVTDTVAAKTPLSAGSWSWSGAYGSSWFIDPARGITLVAFTNTAPEGDSGPFAMAIRRAAYGAAD
jgi:CubicO group peptidase (beta-lactamase class C family)